MFFLQLLLYGVQEYKLQFLVFELSYILIIIYTVRLNYLVSPISLFILISFFYISAGPLDLHYFNNKDLLTPDVIGLTLLFGYSFVWILLLLWSMLCKYKLNVILLSTLDKSLESQNYSLKLRFMVAVLIILFATMYIYKFIAMYGFTIGVVSRGDLFSERNFLLTLAKTVIPIFIITYLWLKKYYDSSRGIIDYVAIMTILIFCIFDVLFKGDRRIVVSLLAGIIAVYYLHRPIPFKYIISVLAGAIVLYFFGAVRNRPIYQWSNNLVDTLSNEFSPSATEFGSFSLVANYLMKDEFFLTIPTLWQSFLSAIPGFIYPDRPLASSLWFVKEYYNDIYISGGGLAFNIIVDSALNFGYLAPLFLAIFYIAFFIIGNQKGKIGVLISSLLIYSLTFSARYDFASILQVILYGWVSLLLVFIVAALLFSKSSR